jgi:quercetin dioxygenase-like cupin family protein
MGPERERMGQVMSDPNELRHAVEAQLLRASRHVDPDGTVVEQMEWCVPVGWSPLPAHRHPDQERHEILDGLVRVEVEGAGRTYRPGESVIVAAHQEHRLDPVEGHGLHACVWRWSRTQAQARRPDPRLSGGGSPTPPDGWR